MKITQEAVDSMIKSLDFEQIHSVMKFMEWSYHSGFPTIAKLKSKARELINEVNVTDSITGVKSGGFSVSQFEDESGKTQLEIAFEIDSTTSN